MMAGPLRIDWFALEERIGKLLAAGLLAAEICTKLGLSRSDSNRNQVRVVKARILAKAKGETRRERAASPADAWVGYEITSDWRDPECVARDMGGQRFKNMPGMGASSSNPVFVPARKAPPSAGVADYLGAR